MEIGWGPLGISLPDSRLLRACDHFKIFLDEKVTIILNFSLNKVFVQDELKSLLSTSEDDRKQSRDELKQLRTQWDERSQMIDQLQEKVVKMKNTFDEKEKRLLAEKKVEMDKYSAVDEQLKACENRHKSQLVRFGRCFSNV